MDRKQQLGNVAFGGNWSEQILGREVAQAWVGVLRRGVEACADVDPRTPEARAVLDALAARVNRGERLAAAWWRAGGMVNPGLRAAEMRRVMGLIESAIGAEAT